MQLFVMSIISNVSNNHHDHHEYLMDGGIHIQGNDVMFVLLKIYD